jgi:hypothetical protein
MNREPGTMKVFRIIGQAFPGWGARQRKIWGVGRRVASPGIESGWFALLGGRCSTKESAIEAAIQAGRQKIDLGFELGSVPVND